MRQFCRTASMRGLRGHSALGLFAAVWLNLALAPCAMAYEAVEDHDCPHCPEQGEMHGHEGMHGDQHAGMVADMPCADDLTDCRLDGEFSLDTRYGNSKLKDSQFEMPAATASGAHEAPVFVLHRQRAPPQIATPRSGSAPPVYLLNCVFLD